MQRLCQSHAGHTNTSRNSLHSQQLCARRFPAANMHVRTRRLPMRVGEQFMGRNDPISRLVAVRERTIPSRGRAGAWGFACATSSFVNIEDGQAIRQTKLLLPPQLARSAYPPNTLRLGFRLAKLVRDVPRIHWNGLCGSPRSWREWSRGNPRFRYRRVGVCRRSTGCIESG